MKGIFQLLNELSEFSNTIEGRENVEIMRRLRYNNVNGPFKHPIDRAIKEADFKIDHLERGKKAMTNLNLV